MPNKTETRAELIDPKLKACGWGIVEGSKILREYHITAGKIQTGGVRAKKLTADYILVYKGIKLWPNSKNFQNFNLYYPKSFTNR